MIRSHQVMDLFLEACPSYRKRLERYIEDNYEPEDKRLPYIELADFAKHVFDLYSQERTEEFEAIFETVETLQTEGDQETKELAIVGFLEDLQNVILSSGSVQLEDFVPFLGPVSRSSWRQLIDYWDGKKV
ncbi:hypothetical protein QWJ34_22225 [Saccharibacillus sp. CPCC 101409]|uniref:DUF7674 family protein n=1 Tax=Saccharibacillus sp. CPCC 101409 TaxID=3058041 RepID=UPI0026727C7C|nr:hypothetical protein [Saccharibacillus sp. CPCC 101409]MDO3412498.1 hypothetical protein [Saccharibacillus sp. CPCC 101409]